MIGIEVHCQLNRLQTKLFCQCKADSRGFAPNENICPVCTGLPGSLPRLNRKAVEKAVLVATALNCKIPENVSFFRKNFSIRICQKITKLRSLTCMVKVAWVLMGM